MSRLVSRKKDASTASVSDGFSCGLPAVSTVVSRRYEPGVGSYLGKEDDNSEDD